MNLLQNEKFKKNPYNEKYLYSVNRATFAKEEAKSVYERFFAEELFKEDSFYIIVGTDSGLLPRYIIEQGLPSNSRYLFIELNSIIHKVQPSLPKDIDEKLITFATPEQWEVLAQELELNIYIYKDQVKFIKSLATIDAHLIEYQTLNLQVQKSLQNLLFFTKAMVGVFPFMTKQLMNICENRHPSTLLTNKFKGHTCILLAGGPSLDENIEWIKAHQDKVVIIAVSRIARSLLKHDLIPHIVVTVDPYELSFDVSKELLRFPAKTLFIQSNSASPSLVAQWHGKSVYLSNRFPWAEPNDKNNSCAGPTVTNAALQAAIGMGFDHILLAGVDLCFSKTGVSHASGSNEANIGPSLNQTGVWVDTYAGQKAETTIVFDQSAEALSTQAKDALSKGIEIYNLSENASAIKHIAHVPTSALSFDKSDDDIWQLIDQCVPDETSDDVRANYKSVLLKIESMLKKLKKVKLMSEDALRCNEMLFRVKGKESENFKYKIKMDKIEKKFDTTYKVQTDFVKNFGMDKFVKSAQTDSDEEWSDEKIEETGRIYYQAFIDSSTSLIEHLELTVQRINNRIEEEKPTPNFEHLFKQWKKDQHFGRINVWQHSIRHNNIEIPDLYSDQVNEFTQEFEKVLSNENTAHLARTKKEASLDGVHRKMVILFHQRNVDGLNVMLANLELYKEDKPEVADLKVLAKAYYLFAKSNFKEAMVTFQSINKDKLTEDELQQIASLGLKLKDHLATESALKELSKLDNQYIPQYAKLLSLLGKTIEAIDLYTNYLTDDPEDTNTWLALGKLYHKLGSNESAIMACQYVLKSDPSNLMARELLINLTSAS